MCGYGDKTKVSQRRNRDKQYMAFTNPDVRTIDEGTNYQVLQNVVRAQRRDESLGTLGGHADCMEGTAFSCVDLDAWVVSYLVLILFFSSSHF